MHVLMAGCARQQERAASDAGCADRKRRSICSDEPMQAPPSAGRRSVQWRPVFVSACRGQYPLFVAVQRAAISSPPEAAPATCERRRASNWYISDVRRRRASITRLVRDVGPLPTPQFQLKLFELSPSRLPSEPYRHVVPSRPYETRSASGKPVRATSRSECFACGCRAGPTRCRERCQGAGRSEPRGEPPQQSRVRRARNRQHGVAIPGRSTSVQQPGGNIADPDIRLRQRPQGTAISFRRRDKTGSC
jgi:hypothetical protein